MKASKAALKAAELYDVGPAFNCCDALYRMNPLLAQRFRNEFAERSFIDEDGAIDGMSWDEINQFRVFLLLFFAEWLRDGGE